MTTEIETKTVRQRGDKTNLRSTTDAASRTGASKQDSPIDHTGRGLITYDELPPWLRDNAYIRTGYRPPSYSMARSLLSIFYLHNESVNVHSHLYGALSFVMLLGASSFLPTPLPLAAMAPFLVGAISCLSLSALFHCTQNVSPTVARTGNQLDYVGIVLLIAGSFMASVNLAFSCDADAVPRRVYVGAMLVLGAACTVVSLIPHFRTPAWRPVRASLFVGLGLFAVFPMGHGLYKWGWTELDRRIGATQMIIEGILYVSGAGLYAARFPERKWPGRFDIWGSSHQIFHLLVVIAAWMHAWGVLRAYGHVQSTDCPVY